eukprot:TRINITY_DN28876_c0_g1_i1.p1 TRINITY_DN28876_c0_g1~~TRINITY_DN28876_c0_g1_i1.p1  ORF type:complete len:347 (+),score=64.53 TRINITY_DN28876_c0_g1_i1:77-1117(+)
MVLVTDLVAPGSIAPLKKRVSKIVFGTLFLHITDDPYGVLDTAWGLGINTYDCAAIYGQGKCETVLGCWLKDRGYQDEAVVITKGGCAGQSDLWAPRLDSQSIIKDLEDSRARLGLSVVDIYMLHRDDKEIDVGVIVDGMTKLVTEGMIRSWAVSNWSVERIAAACRYASDTGSVPPSCSSIQAALTRPQHEVWPGTTYMTPGDMRWYAENDMPVLAWECLAKGFLAGRWDRVVETFKEGRTTRPVKLTDSTADEWRTWKLHSAYLTSENIQKYERSKLLAEKLGCTSAVVGLAWVLSQPCNSFAIIGTTKSEHIREITQAATIHLTPEQCAWLEGGAQTNDATTG